MGRMCRIVRRGRISSRRVLVLCVAVFVMTVGCQTSRSFSDGCPGIYSGVRYYNSQINTIPWDGRIFFAVDLPLSMITDTLLLPVTPFLKAERPLEGWVPGCEWAGG